MLRKISTFGCKIFIPRFKITLAGCFMASTAVSSQAGSEVLFSEERGGHGAKAFAYIWALNNTSQTALQRNNPSVRNTLTAPSLLNCGKTKPTPDPKCHLSLLKNTPKML